jgi:hypothetical protein
MKQPDSHTAPATYMSALCPNGSNVVSKTQATLNIPQLPATAKVARVFEGITSANLLSTGQLCDAGCTAIYTAKDVKFFKGNASGECIMEGKRNPTNGLWDVKVDLVPTSTNKQQNVNGIIQNKTTKTDLVNGIIRKKTTKTDLVKYHHISLGSPTSVALLNGIKKGFLTTFPGLTEELVKKHLPKSIDTAKGHLQQQRQGLQSTKIKNPPAKVDAYTLEGPSRTSVFMATVEPIATGRAFGDLTGQYPHMSSRGNKYILIIYDYDTNAIIAEPLKGRTKGDILNGYRNVHKQLARNGYKPTMQTLDNEASDILLEYMRNNKIDIQLAPPHIHRRNLAERAIRTFKEHFKALRASCDPLFPKHLWCRLLQQATLSLNLLREARLHPQLSSYHALWGAFDYNRTPLAPPGTKVLVHEKPQQRNTWDDNGVEGWYLGPAMSHYRCYRCYVSATHGERNSDTVEFFPTKVNMPALSTQDKAIEAIHDLIALLKNPKPANPFLTYGPQATAAIETMADIFQTNETTIETDDTSSPRVPVTKHIQSPPRVQKSVPPSSQPPPRVPTKATVSPPKDPQPNPPTHQYGTRTATQKASKKTILQPSYKARALNHILNSERVYNGMLNAVTDPLTGIQMEYKDLMKDPSLRPTWIKAMANEFGRLAQGVGTRMPTGSGTIHFITPDRIPKGKFATYARIVCDIRPQKAEKHRVRLTVGGNLINYPHKVSTPTADLATVKCLFNSVVSTLNAIFTGADIKDFYLNTPLDEYEYMRISADLIPDEIMDQYNLRSKIVNGFIYMEIRKGMYGLPQAGIIAHNLLKEHLAKYGYAPCKYTPGLWGHTSRKTKFCLVVDDFGIKTTSDADLQHLLSALKDKYTISIDTAGELFCGIHSKS